MNDYTFRPSIFTLRLICYSLVMHDKTIANNTNNRMCICVRMHSISNLDMPQTIKIVNVAVAEKKYHVQKLSNKMNLPCLQVT